MRRRAIETLHRRFTCEAESHTIASSMQDETSGKAFLYTVGHSNHAIEKFVALLEQYQIEALVDVRSHPSSRYNPQYNAPPLSAVLKEHGIRYLFLGKELGGRPDDERYYDESGRVLYNEWAESPVFLEGIERVKRGAEKFRIALMCSEENPQHCHRRLLVTPVLRDCGIEVLHLRGDGDVQPESDFLTPQPSLFGDEGVSWKSVKPIMAKKQSEDFDDE